MRGPSGSFRQTARLGSSRRKVKQPVDFFVKNGCGVFQQRTLRVKKNKKFVLKT